MLETLIFVAGFGQLVLVVCSLAIPKVLNWAEETSKLRPLTRQVFWTYAGYIWVTNLSFALISMISPSSLTDKSFLAVAVTIYIVAYWLARVIIQFTWFDRSDTPKGLRYLVAEALLVGLFVGLTLVYGWAVLENLAGAAV
jgi:hypothetical protein